MCFILHALSKARATTTCCYHVLDLRLQPLIGSIQGAEYMVQGTGYWTQGSGYMGKGYMVQGTCIGKSLPERFGVNDIAGAQSWRKWGLFLA